MKITSKAPAFILAISMVILSVSCTERNLDLKTNSGIPPMSGGIVDMGVVSGDVHHMSLSLSGVEFNTAGKSATIPPVTGSVHIELFTDTDGIINNGTYKYSAAGDNSPFTFRSGALYFSPVTKNFNAFAVNGGSMTVVRTGISYYITLDVTVSSGDAFTGHFDGNLSYMDTTVPY